MPRVRGLPWPRGGTDVYWGRLAAAVRARATTFANPSQGEIFHLVTSSHHYGKIIADDAARLATVVLDIGAFLQNP